jgi:predicted transcriptional regulator
MPILKAPPKLIRNATIQVRVEDEIDTKLRKYAEFIDATPAFVVAESLRMLFSKDAEFREWLTHHAAKPSVTQAEKPAPQEPAQTRAGAPTIFDVAPQRVANK